jgi:alanine racemase
MWSDDPAEPITLRPTVVEVDLGRLRRNLAAIRGHVGAARVMAVVKANAYGHGLVRVAQELAAAGADELGVAFLEEGIALRKAGLTLPILVLGGIIGNQVRHFLDHDLQITASSVFKLRQIDEVAGALGRRAQVHLKLDTGMGRLGVRWDRAEALFAAAVEARHCDLRGVFSHLANSDSADPRFTHTQTERFLSALEFFPRHGLPMPRRHLANSGGILQHPETILDMARPGILLYGVYPGPEVERSISVEPVLAFKTRVVYFKVVSGGSSVGYDLTWTAPSDTRVVTLPVGYGDGYSRALSNRGQVLINGRRHPLVGRLSMDQCSVDIADDSAYNGDEVVLIGHQRDGVITVEEVAEWVGTIPYEILTMINTRVPRQYV